MPDTLLGTDAVKETVVVNGLTFSAQLGIGGARWLEKTLGKSLMAIAKDLDAMVRSIKDNPDAFQVSVMAPVFVALYLQAHRRCDPLDAEAAVDSLSLPEMNELMGRVRPFVFDKKNAPAGQATTTENPTPTPQ